MYENCLNCLRKLTDPQSRRVGFGSECRETLGDQQTYIDAAKSAVLTRATADSTLIVLGRILKKHEDALLLFREEQIIPLSIVKNLRKIRADFERRARQLHGLGQLYVPQPQVTASAVLVTALQATPNERTTFK